MTSDDIRPPNPAGKADIRLLWDMRRGAVGAEAGEPPRSAWGLKNLPLHPHPIAAFALKYRAEGASPPGVAGVSAGDIGRPPH
ncbi:hypothetical protein CHELA1G11_14185 [Hyphomicrobiales bacterium]|nr:hypothetical protein CHELA1G2_10129 [Hyphomicrobiales bacterium]CAH1676823.1 hypothetical protein CHELA1G11_14185 [Hyphomicrobiales bacterium]